MYSKTKSWLFPLHTNLWEIPPNKLGRNLYDTRQCCTRNVQCVTSQGTVACCFKLHILHVQEMSSYLLTQKATYFIPGGKLVYPAFQRICFYGIIYLSFKSSFISVLTSVGEMCIATGPHISSWNTCTCVSYGVKLTYTWLLPTPHRALCNKCPIISRELLSSETVLSLDLIVREDLKKNCSVALPIP